MVHVRPVSLRHRPLMPFSEVFTPENQYTMSIALETTSVDATAAASLVPSTASDTCSSGAKSWRVWESLQ